MINNVFTKLKQYDTVIMIKMNNDKSGTVKTTVLKESPIIRLSIQEKLKEWIKELTSWTNNKLEYKKKIAEFRMLNLLSVTSFNVDLILKDFE